MMYAALWRALPGTAGTKIVVLVILAAGLVAVAFTWVFPAIADRLPLNEQTVAQGRSLHQPSDLT